MNTFEQLLNDWRTRFDEMKVQWNLGKMDAAEAFEEQKKQLKAFIGQVKETLDKGAGLAEEQAKELRTRLEELNVQLHLGKAETMEAFEAQRKKIEPALDNLYSAAKQAYQTGYRQVMDLFDTQSDWFRTNLEIMQLRYSLARMEARDEADELRKKLDARLAELSEHSRKWQEQVKGNAEEWTAIARENLEKFREWLKGLPGGN